MREEPLHDGIKGILESGKAPSGRVTQGFWHTNLGAEPVWITGPSHLKKECDKRGLVDMSCSFGTKEFRHSVGGCDTR